MVAWASTCGAPSLIATASCVWSFSPARTGAGSGREAASFLEAKESHAGTPGTWGTLFPEADKYLAEICTLNNRASLEGADTSVPSAKSQSPPSPPPEAEPALGLGELRELGELVAGAAMQKHPDSEGKEIGVD